MPPKWGSKLWTFIYLVPRICASLGGLLNPGTSCEKQICTSQSTATSSPRPELLTEEWCCYLLLFCIPQAKPAVKIIVCVREVNASTLNPTHACTSARAPLSVVRCWQNIRQEHARCMFWLKGESTQVWAVAFLSPNKTVYLPWVYYRVLCTLFA